VAKVKEGIKAPSVKLLNQDGKEISLKDLLGKWVVLYFYPKDLTPGCTQEACDFSKGLPKFKSSKAVIFGVSKDSVSLHKKFSEKYKLAFDLLSDEDIKVCKAYGVYKKKSLYGREYMGIERSTFIINPKGKIAKIYPKVKVNGHADEVLNFIKAEN